MNTALIPTQSTGASTHITKTPGRFRRFSTRCARALGSHLAFYAACLLVLLWLLTGPYFHFSDTWQLVINSFTSVVTFLMVFMIQNTQNRESTAMNLKLDELIRSVGPARNSLIRLEDLDDEDLAHLEQEFLRLRDRSTTPRHHRPTTQGAPAGSKTS